jgi:predicted Rossmann-fold nucleotide-binding protein
VLNVAGYYDHLLAWIAHSVDVGLVKSANLGLIVAGSTVDEVLDGLRSKPFPLETKWMGR